MNPPLPGRPTLLQGWGRERAAATVANVVHPRTPEEVAEALVRADTRGALPRGLGRSYGDTAQVAGGLVLDCTELTGPVRLDRERGEASAPAGVSMGRLIEHLLHRSHFVPVSPGTRHVTLGGAVAADVHGKNHHTDSSFGAHVRALTLIGTDGTTRRLRPDGGDTELFWATVGGMGLTGVITEVTFAVQPVETAYARVDTDRTRNLEQTLELMARTDAGYRYTVCWVDLLARGPALGRGILTRAHHAVVRDLPAPMRRRPLRHRATTPLVVPPGVAPAGLVNRWTVGAFNSVYYNAGPRRERGQAQPLTKFFHPLDAVAGWNRAYGPPGFVQYQFVVPFGAEDTLRAVVEDLSRAQAPSFLAVLKRMGEATPAPLSFPRPGWSLAVDLPADLPGLGRMLNGFDERLLAAGGRLYLVKDVRAEAETVQAMYPGLPAWRRVRERADPRGVLVSDQARRLGLV